MKTLVRKLDQSGEAEDRDMPWQDEGCGHGDLRGRDDGDRHVQRQATASMAYPRSETALAGGRRGLLCP